VVSAVTDLSGLYLVFLRYLQIIKQFVFAVDIHVVFISFWFLCSVMLCYVHL